MAVSFNGTTSVIDMGNGGVLNLANNAPISFMTWVNFSSLAGTQAFLAKGFDGTNTAYQFQQSTTPSLFAGSFNSSTGTHGTTWNPSTWSTSQWHHAYAEYTGNPGTQTWSIYIDGVFIVSTVDATGPINIGGRSFTLGAVDNSGFGSYIQFFAGCMADTVVFNGPLTPTEISQLGTGLIRPPSVASQTMLGYWALDTALTTQPDLSGNNNNGTATATTTCANSPPYATVIPVGTMWM